MWEWPFASTISKLLPCMYIDDLILNTQSSGHFFFNKVGMSFQDYCIRILKTTVMSQMLFHREAGVNFLLMDMVDFWVHASRAVRMWKSGEKFYFGLDCGYLKDQICSK